MNHTPEAVVPSSVLVVDDLPDNLEILSRILVKDGCDVRAVKSGAEALNQVQIAMPDLILLDLKMPDMDGLNVCRRLKADARTSDIPIVFISAVDETAEKMKAFEAGGVDYILKPFQMEEVLARVRTQLALCSMRQNLTQLNLELEDRVQTRTRELEEANLRLQSEITERNQAEEKFRNFVLQSIDGIALCDDDFIIIEWNQQMEQITGLARSEVIGTTIWDAVYQTVPGHIRNPQLYEALQKEYSQVFSDKSSSYVRRKNNFKVQHENGILRDVQVFNFPFKTSSGVMLGISCRDVTERKQAERELVETRDQLENLIETSVDPIRITNERGSIVRVNHAYAKLLGYTPAEMVGKHVAEMAPAEPGVYETINGDPITVDEGFFSETQDMVARLLTTGRVSSFHGLSQRADGIVLITEESNALLYNDQREVTGAVGILRDITERARTENNLKRLATAVAAADEIIFITDSAGIIQYVNPAFTQVTGYCFDEVAGKTPAILKSGKQDTAFYKNLWDTILCGETWKGRIKNKKKNGELFTEDATISSIRDEKDQITNFVAVKRDITQELSLESQLRQAQKMEAIGTMAGGIAHDFNNILTAIIGFTEMSLPEVPQESELHFSLSTILKSGLRARDLVKQILTFSRQSEQEMRPVMVIPIVKEVYKFLQASLPATISKRLRLDVESAIVMADPTQLHQILMNLCTNAAHAMKEHGGELDLCVNSTTLNEEELAVRCPELNHPGRYLELSVHDTGCGMGRDVLDHIFEPYFTTKDQGEGTGLGLAVVHGIIRSSGGSISVQSTAGKGTVFTVLLPQIDVEEADEGDESAELPGGTERILIVDDEPNVNTMLEKRLKRLGYKVTAVLRAEDAFTCFSDAPDDFDLVITDKTMPDITGFELANVIRRIRPGTPVIICSGYADNKDLERAEQLGIRKFIAKPIDTLELARAIREVLDEESS